MSAPAPHSTQDYSVKHNYVSKERMHDSCLLAGKPGRCITVAFWLGKMLITGS